MVDKCPICFSDIGDANPVDFMWTDDPILTTPAPSVGIITYDDYKGFTQLKAKHIRELQQNRRQLEINLSITPTNFSFIDEDNFFQNIETFIYELRISTENILSSLGLTKDEYFNYDKNGSDMRPGNHQIDWTDIPFPVYKLSQFQSKAKHIEDLRHFIQVQREMERWGINFEEGTIEPEYYTLLGDIKKPPSRPWNGQLNAPGEAYNEEQGWTVHWGTNGTKGHQTSFNLWGEAKSWDNGTGYMGTWVSPFYPNANYFQLNGYWNKPIYVNENKIFNIGISGSAVSGYIDCDPGYHQDLNPLVYIMFGIGLAPDSSWKSSGWNNIFYYLVFSKDGDSIPGPYGGGEIFHPGYSEGEEPYPYDGFYTVRDYRDISTLGDVQIDIWNNFSKVWVDTFYKAVWNPGTSHWDPIYDSEGNLIPTLTSFQWVNIYGKTEGSFFWRSGSVPFPIISSAPASLSVSFDNIGLEKI